MLDELVTGNKLHIEAWWEELSESLRIAIATNDLNKTLKRRERWRVDAEKKDAEKRKRRKTSPPSAATELLRPRDRICVFLFHRGLSSQRTGSSLAT